ncbi:MAG: CopG family transcriptional regulator [Verrucomicrobia bacterium]|jgi:hypothetical protein|nr:CopG family transcriptional regulator [Verrucomicrobiota bacterium]
MNEPSTTPKTISAEELDRLADSGEDLSEYFDLSTITRPGHEVLYVQIKLPFNLLQKIESEAAKRGMTREALMEAWLGEKAG